jgi:4-hydroxy-tetrahydrodipicolinate reductase
MNFQVVEVFDENKPFLESSGSLADVAIDFTLPELAASHIKHAVDIKLPIVVGTTGWYHSFEEISDYVKQNNGSLFYATNFSIGVNLFFAINKKLAQMMNQQTDYRARIEEIHHTEKKDAPSGTAITLAEQTIEMLDGLSTYHLLESAEKSQISAINSLPITAIREPNVPGTHTITYESDIDNISITHEAKSRLGFAQGAVHAAYFLRNQVGIYNMTDLLNF